MSLTPLALADSDTTLAALARPLRRRSFLRVAGASAGAAALVLAGCKKEKEANPLLDVGSGDVGALNYLYALKQVEASFYAKVVGGNYYGALSRSSAEYQILSDIALHERNHADVLRTALGSLGGAIKVLNDMLSDQVNFGDRTTVAASGKLGVLNAAQQLEDLGVAAYNGAVRYFSTASYLLLAGKIVSVEARHAALIRDLLLADGTPNLGQGFVGPDVIDPTTRLERSLAPAAVLPRLNAYLAVGSQLSAPSLT